MLLTFEEPLFAPEETLPPVTCSQQIKQARPRAPWHKRGPGARRARSVCFLCNSPESLTARSARISSFKVGVWMAANEVSQGPVLANQHSTPTGQTRKEESTECRPAAHKKAKENGGGAKRGKSSPCRDCVRITEVGSGVPLLFPLFHSNKRNRIRVYRKAVKERRRTP